MTIIQKIWLWLGIQSGFTSISTYVKNNEIMAITFSKDKWYIKQVTKIKRKKK